MPWFRVDDTFSHHAKVLAAGNAAVGLWTRAGSWSMQQLTDGFVPTHVVRTMGSSTEARRLVDAGLWLAVDGGYRFHQWDSRQPSRERLEAERHAATERQRRAREAAKSQRESRRDTAVSHGPPIPSHPIPVTPDADASGGAGKPAARKRAQQLPDDFVPNDTNRAIATERGLDLRAVFEQFADHHRARGSTMKDWHAAFNTWLRRERPQQRPTTPEGLPRSENMQAHLALVRELEAQERADPGHPMLGGA